MVLMSKPRKRKLRISSPNEKRFDKCIRSSGIPGIAHYMTKCNAMQNMDTKCMPTRIWKHPAMKTCMEPVVKKLTNPNENNENKLRAGLKITIGCIRSRCNPTKERINVIDSFINRKTTIRQFMKQSMDMKVNARSIKYSKCVVKCSVKCAVKRKKNPA